LPLLLFCAVDLSLGVVDDDIPSRLLLVLVVDLVVDFVPSKEVVLVLGTGNAQEDPRNATVDATRSPTPRALCLWLREDDGMAVAGTKAAQEPALLLVP